MKNTKKIAVIMIVAILCLATALCCVACDNSKDNRKTITVWVSETSGVKTLTEQQVQAYLDANPDYASKYKVVVEGISEADAATQMITDVESGADIFCFAQDQLARLVEANAVSKLGTAAVQYVEDNNDAGSIKAASVGDATYAYPITSDNGYFMYYDKSVVSEEHIDDLAAIVADCEAAGKAFSFELENAWYTASFFFATGCTSSWKMDPETNMWKAADNFKSDEGLIAMRGMQILTKSKAFVNSSKTADFSSGSAVVVSGTWGSDDAIKNLGDKYGVADLPSFTIDGKSYHLGSFSGYKLMGVKPHTNADEAVFCHSLAQVLSGKDAQEARFDLVGWGPSNKEAQALDKVKANVALTALAEQTKYATLQGNIHGGWWDIAKLLGTASKNAELGDTKALQDALDSYQASINKFETMTVEAMNAYGVVGTIASLKGVKENLSEGQTEWIDWNTDLAMTESKGENGEAIWTSKVAVTLAEGDKFQVRQGQSWDSQFGAIGTDGYSTKSDYAITADNAGTYYIKLVINKDGKGIVSLVAAE